MIRHYAFLAVPVLFFLAFGIEEIGLWMDRRKKNCQQPVEKLLGQQAMDQDNEPPYNEDKERDRAESQ